MTNMVPCPHCPDGFVGNARTTKDVCKTCGGTGKVEARTGESREASYQPEPATPQGAGETAGGDRDAELRKAPTEEAYALWRRRLRDPALPVPPTSREAFKAGYDAATAAPEQAGSRGWTLQSIAAWCEETFGPIQPARIVSRAAEEMDELRAEPTRVEEAADVVIVLARYPGLWDEIQRKMEINRNRRWRLMGDGTGYHIKDEPPAAARPHSDAEDQS